MTHNTRKHARLGGSTAARWLNCYASVALCESLPPQIAGDAAQWGTAVHEISERGLRSFLDYKLTGIPYSPAISADDEATELAESYVQCVWADVLHQSLTGKAYGIEEEVVLDEKLGMYGIVDFWCVHIDDRGKRVLTILDLKTGYHYVDVEKNEQFLFYGLALRQELQNGGKNFDILRTCIFQPRATPGPAFREASYTSKQLETWKSKFLKAAKEIYTGSTKFVAGDHCQWCAGKSVCPTYAKSISDNSSLALLEPDTFQFPKVDMIPDEVLAKLLTYKPKLEDFLDELTKYAINRAQNGTPIPGFKVVSGATRRTWIESTESVAEKLIDAGMPNPWVSKLVTITAAEKAVGKDALAGCTTTTKPSVVLVPDSDPRPALSGAKELLK